MNLSEIPDDQVSRKELIINRFKKTGFFVSNFTKYPLILIEDRSSSSTYMIVFEEAGVIILNESTE